MLHSFSWSKETSYKCSRSVWPDLAKFYLGIFEGLFGSWYVFWTYSSNLYPFEQIFKCCKWPIVEQIIHSSGHTALDVKLWDNIIAMSEKQTTQNVFLECFASNIRHVLCSFLNVSTLLRRMKTLRFVTYSIFLNRWVVPGNFFLYFCLVNNYCS